MDLPSSIILLWLASPIVFFIFGLYLAFRKRHFGKWLIILAILLLALYLIIQPKAYLPGGFDPEVIALE